MVIEHEFVTTLPPAAALAAAQRLLSDRGFSRDGASGESAFPVAAAGGDAPAWADLEMRRGKKRPTQVKAFADLPQAVRVEVDRGLVQLAAVVEPFRKAKPWHEQWLRSVAATVESAMTGAGAPAAGTPVDLAEREINGDLRKAHRRRWVMAALLIFGVLALIGTAVTAANS